MIEELVEEFRIVIKEENKKKIKIEFEDDNHKEIFIRGDQDRLKEVISNIIDNALKYTPEGFIKVSVKLLRGKKVLINVQDSGIGMDKETIDKIFDKFARAGEALQYHTSGSGLGLFIAKEFVKAHKGKLWAESKGKGKGSVFFVELPASS